MKLRVTPQARRHLEAIAEYLAKTSPAASRGVGERIRETIQLLTTFPMIGHEGSLPGTREMVVPACRTSLSIGLSALAMARWSLLGSTTAPSGDRARKRNSLKK